MNVEKISKYTLWVLFGLSILVFGLFVGIDFGRPYELEPKYNDPVCMDLLMWWMIILVVAAVAVTLWGLFNSLTTKGTGTMKETGLIAHTNSIAWGACVASVVLGAVIGFAQKSEVILINGKEAVEEKSSFGVVGDRIATDTIIVSIAVLMIVVFAATIWSFIPSKK